MGLMDIRRRAILNSPHEIPEWETAGPDDIVSFESDWPVPMKSLVVGIDPVQDLHGYDNPWPAGGGKNLLNYDNCINNLFITTAGKFDDVPGANVFYAYVKPNTTYTFSCEKGDRLNIASSASIPANEVRYTRLVYRDANGYSGPVTITTESNETMLCFFVNRYASGKPSWVQLEEGSQATAWAPYSNICPISGRTGMTVQRTGKNLISPPEYTSSGATLCLDLGADFTFDAVTLSFKATDAVSLFTNAAIIDFLKEDGTHQYVTLAGFYNEDGVRWAPDTTLNGVFSDTKRNITFRKAVVYYEQNSYSKFQTDCLSNWQLEIGSTATDYEPYAGNTYPISWQSEAGTVYGGTLDVVSGLLTVDKASVDLGTLSWSNPTESGRCSAPLGAKASTGSTTLSDISCSAYEAITARQWYNASANGITICGNGYGTNGNCGVCDTRLVGKTSAEVGTILNGVQLVYEPATPQTYQLTPTEVRTLLGVNNVWADTGQVEVQYWVKD